MEKTVKINVTGYNQAELIAELKNCVGSHIEILVEKTKEVRATTTFIDYTITQNNKEILHKYLNPVPLTNLHDVGKGWFLEYVHI